jgi:hypothetical protein
MTIPIPRLQLPPAAPPNEFYHELRERVRRMRLDLGITSYAAARAAGMHAPGYCNFEMGNRRISILQFFKLQQLFGYVDRL